MQAQGNDRLSFVCELDLGDREVPSDWSKALALLKKNYVTSMLIKAFAEVTQHRVVIITENGVRKFNYISEHS